MKSLRIKNPKFKATITKQARRVHSGGIVTLNGYLLRYEYPNGQYGCSFHETRKGALIARANRRRASDNTVYIGSHR